MSYLSEGSGRFAPKPLATAVLALIAVLAMVYILPKALSTADGLDFRLVWLAGSMWSTGADPYSAAFLARYVEAFGPGPVTHFWVYPPHWFPLAVPLSHLPFAAAVVTWKLLSVLALIAGTWLTALALDRVKPLPLFLGGLSLVCFMQGTAVAISIGQTSTLLLLALGLLLFGLARSNTPAMMAAIVLGSLKPNIGITIAAMVLARGFWQPIVGSLAIIVAAAVPVFTSNGTLATLKSFASNIERYSGPGLDANNPPDLTGISHIFDLATGQAIPSIGLALAAALISLLVCWRAPRDQVPNLVKVNLCVAILLVLTPLHSYDMMLVVVVAMAAMSMRHASRWIVLAGVALMARSANLAILTGLHHPRTTIFMGSLIDSIGLVTIAVGCLWLTLGRTVRVRAHALT